VPLKSGVESHLNLSGVGATGPKRELSLLPWQQSHISCHSFTKNLQMLGISSSAGIFIPVTGRERADLAAVSTLSLQLMLT